MITRTISALRDIDVISEIVGVFFVKTSGTSPLFGKPQGVFCKKNRHQGPRRDIGNNMSVFPKKLPRDMILAAPGGFRKKNLTQRIRM